MTIRRRDFVIGSVCAGGVAAQAKSALTSDSDVSNATELRPLIVSTWPFGKAANERALEVIQAGGSPLDGVEQGIRVTESDAENSSVGIGGTPNARGVVQLDACIMDGPEHRAGSVAAMEGILHPISVARRVMENTKHVMLVGEGAREFAIGQGFESVSLLTESQRIRWLEWSAKASANDAVSGANPANGHDTIALLVLGTDGHFAGGCSTSGLAYKLVGRVGDSPILGSGLYVDDKVGAAGATGIGENVMRYCASFLIVEMMRGGMHPQDACVSTIRRIASIDSKRFDLDINFIAVDRDGRFGAAGTGKGFHYSVTTPRFSEVLQSAAVTG